MPVQTYTMNAYAVGRGIDLARILKKPPYPVAEKERNLVVLQPGGESFIFVHSFGALVCFNLPHSKKVVNKFRRYAYAPIAKWPQEEHAIIIGADSDAITFDEVNIREFSLEKLGLISIILAQSVMLEHIEDLIDVVLTRFEQINLNLERQGKLLVKSKELIHVLGTTNLILQQILARLALLDKPDITWDSLEFQTLFGHLRKIYELDDRFRAVEFKIDSIQDNSKALLSILQDRRTERLEVTIIILILIEVLLFIYELFG